MTERIETVTTPDGLMEVFITHPGEHGRAYPVIVQLMDGLGMREELRDHARRTASWGYYVIAPDLYYRFGFSYPLDYSDPDSRDAIMAAISELTVERVTSDIEAVLKLARNDTTAGNGKIGLYGFCMGGKLTLELSQILGGKLAAGASIHPGGLATDSPQSPHRYLDNIEAELYFGIADNDAMATPEQMAALEVELKANKIRYRLERHDGASHGYMMPSRPELYDEHTAERVWDRIKILFDRNLR